MIPSQKLGIETPHRETALARRSQTVLRRTAEKTPAGMAIPMAMSSEKAASCIVIGSFDRHRLDHRLPRADGLAQVAPGGPASSQRRYWTGMGSFRPYFARISCEPGLVGVRSGHHPGGIARDHADAR